jgi:hypothetical protein
VDLVRTDVSEEGITCFVKVKINELGTMFTKLATLTSYLADFHPDDGDDTFL